MNALLIVLLGAVMVIVGLSLSFSKDVQTKAHQKLKVSENQSQLEKRDFFWIRLLGINLAFFGALLVILFL